MLITDHPDERALLNGVLAAPLDDAPRLVLADWYDENGQEERAWYIRYRIDGARNVGMLPNIFHSPDERNCDIASRQYGTSNVWFHRGFMHSFHIDHNSWEEHADSILAEHPIEVVRLMTAPEMERMYDIIQGNRVLRWCIGGYAWTNPDDAFTWWESQWTESRPWLRFERPNPTVPMFRGNRATVHVGGQQLRVTDWSIGPVTDIATPAESASEQSRRRRLERRNRGHEL